MEDGKILKIKKILSRKSWIRRKSGDVFTSDRYHLMVWSVSVGAPLTENFMPFICCILMLRV